MVIHIIHDQGRGNFTVFDLTTKITKPFFSIKYTVRLISDVDREWHKWSFYNRDNAEKLRAFIVDKINAMDFRTGRSMLDLREILKELHEIDDKEQAKKEKKLPIS